MCRTNRICQKGLVLIDAGCELQYYASDVTRTFPVSGVLVLLSATCMTLCWRRTVPSTPAVREYFNHPHEAATLILVEGLIELGLLQGDPEQLIAQGDHEKFVRIRPPIGWDWMSTTLAITVWVIHG